jgi:hypothetical protein
VCLCLIARNCSKIVTGSAENIVQQTVGKLSILLPEKVKILFMDDVKDST